MPNRHEKNFAISIARLDAREIVGLKIRTTMETCEKEAPRLWHDAFAPWISRLYPDGNCACWGASAAYDAATASFDYWAGLELPAGIKKPGELHSLILPEGYYAQCVLTSLAELHTAYHYLYSRWLPKQESYVGIEQGICFEYYAPDYLRSGKLTVNIPVAPR